MGRVLARDGFELNLNPIGPDKQSDHKTTNEISQPRCISKGRRILCFEID